MYVSPNFKYKKQLIEAVKAGKKVEVYLPGYRFGGPLTGDHSVEGPHYPELHRWYARVRVVENMVVEVIS
jgi:hypothetical protein